MKEGGRAEHGVSEGGKGRIEGGKGGSREGMGGSREGSLTGLDIGLVGPVARGASRFENLLAPQKTNWSLPQNQTCATKKYLHKPTICT